MPKEDAESLFSLLVALGHDCRGYPDAGVRSAPKTLRGVQLKLFIHTHSRLSRFRAM